MIIRKRIKITLATILVIFACKQPIEETVSNKIFVDNSNIEETKDISAWVNEIRIVPLNESKGNFISDVYKLFIVNEQYIIWDRLGAQKINLYDKDGNFIKNIFKIGAGPNETLQINDCWLNNDNELEVYDYALKKVYQFDSSFVLKKVIKFPDFCFFSNLINIPKTKDYIGYANFNQNHNEIKPYHLAFLDKNLNFKKKDFFYDKKFQGILWLSLKNHFYKFEDTIRLLQPYNNYIYNITESNIEKKYKIIYSENQIPDDVFESIVNNHLEKFKNPDGNPNETSSYLREYTFFTGEYFENQNYIYFYSGQDKRYGFISCYNKNTKKAEYSAKQLCEQQRYKIDLPHLQFFDQASNTFIGVFMGDELRKHIRTNSKFLQELTIDESKFYIVQIKLRDEIH